MRKPPDVAIIGGGISGLSAAWYLEQSQAESSCPVQIDLFESSDRTGGKIFTRRDHGLVMEMGAESFLSRKPAGVALCRELGIEDRLQGTRPENRKTYVWREGQLHRLPEGLSGFVPAKLGGLMSTSLLSLTGKLRVAADLLIPADKSLEDESVASFITRRIGKQGYRRLAQPLLCGIYCADGEQLSLAATFPELRKLEREHGSIIRGLRSRKKQASCEYSSTPFVTLAGGMSSLIEAICEKLQTTRIRLSHAVTDLKRIDNRWAVNYTDKTGQSHQKVYDSIILATPAYQTAKMLRHDQPGFSQTLNRIPHVSTAAVNLWYEADNFEHALDGYGFVVPADQQNGLTAVTWTSSKHFGRAPDSTRLIRAYVGRAGDEIDPNTSDEEILQLVKREIKRTMGVTSQLTGYVVGRWIKGSPQYSLQHPSILSEIDKTLAQLPGLYLCGASYRGVGIPDCIRNSKLVAEQVYNELNKSDP